MVANEIARRFTKNSIAIEVKRCEESRLDSMHMETLGGGRIRSPSENGVFSGNGSNAKVVDFKV